MGYFQPAIIKSLNIHKGYFILLVFLLLTNSGISQTQYAKGYFVDNDGIKTDCYIKDLDWNTNPNEFKYKLTQNSEPIILNIKNVKEFGVTNESKFIRFKGPVDRTGNRINSAVDDGRLVFQEEEIYLRVLVEGKASLYVYRGKNLQLYFLKTDENDIEQLVNKYYKIEQLVNKYYKDGNEAVFVRQNSQYKRQLFNSLKCSSLNQKRFEKVNYKLNDLTKLIVDYNKCMDSEITWIESAQNKYIFNLTIRPGVKNSTLTIDNNKILKDELKFDSKIGFRLGLEAEFIFPFNNGKWAFVTEPTYQSYKSFEEANSISGVYESSSFELDYTSLEIPIGIRHYFFLNQDSKIFINAFFVLDFSFGDDNFIYSAKPWPWFDEPTLVVAFDSNVRSNLAFGFGYKLQNYSLEVRYGLKRELLPKYNSWITDFQSLSLILGYTLF